MEVPVTREEAALLVLGYLEREWPATAAAYRAEAAGLLASLSPADGSVKPLQDVLNEYVQLESAARKRAEFECSFGESVAVRSFLSKLGKLLDDYVGLREGLHGPTPGAQELAAAATRGARGEASACVSTTRRERKSSKPSRRAIGTGGPAVNSRRLFGRSSGDAAMGASSSCFELQPSACAGGKDALEEHLPLLSERIAQHINTLPDRAAGAGRSTGEMSIDDVMTALLSDPQSATALSSFVRSPPTMAPRQERPNSPIVSFSQSASRSDERVGSKRLISSLTCDEEDECVRPDAAALEATKQPQRNLAIPCAPPLPRHRRAALFQPAVESDRRLRSDHARMSIDIRLGRMDRVYRPGDKVVGTAVVIVRGSSLSHDGIALSADGSASLQLSAKSVGLFEAFYSTIKPQKLFGFNATLAPTGKLTDGTHEFDFEFEVRGTEGEKLLESYHGVYINTQYVITVEVRRGMLAKNLKRSVEFIVEVPEPRQLKLQPMPFSIVPESLENVRKSALSRIPTFKITGVLDSVICSIQHPLSGEVIVEECSATIKSIELQLVRVETCSYADGMAREATEIQNIQIADGSVCQGWSIPIHMVFPRLFTCPTVLTRTFKVEFEVNLVILFSDGHLLTENFPLKLLRTA